jgi:catechol 2,3-dioxygenase-like lactoylglutathione lyase family enzyme
MMDYRLEVITLPVSDVDAAVRFYTERAGFTLDVDYRPNSRFRVVQLTPPGSSCSVQLGVGLTDAKSGSARTTTLVVTDIEAARRELIGRGLAVGPIRHKASTDDWQGDYSPGVDPERRSYASFTDFADPDGNTWIVQERGFTRTASTTGRRI